MQNAHNTERAWALSIFPDLREMQKVLMPRGSFAVLTTSLNPDTHILVSALIEV